MSTIQFKLSSALENGAFFETSSSATTSWVIKTHATSGTGLTKYGVHSTVSSGTLNFGLYGNASGGANSYGVYGAASASSSNTYGGYFVGDLGYTGTLRSISDSRLKRDVTPLSADAVSKLMSLVPRAYRFASDEELATEGIPPSKLPAGVHFGLIAQELETVFPTLVQENLLFNPENPSGESFPSLTVNYLELIPVLIAVVQEQQAEIAALQNAVRGAGIELPDNSGRE